MLALSCLIFVRPHPEELRSDVSKDGGIGSTRQDRAARLLTMRV